MNLLTLINKRFIVPETNTRRFEPTLAEKRQALKKDQNYSIMKKRAVAVGANPTQKSPSK
ncbi:hypothetical protein J2X12_004140 [Pseudarthrobacter oxydans]|uniref:Uncharacterized protein n=1 Tax=Pseudarthrobacter oxydans TaxID=1671 RepID=A0AAW8NG81_PSEOX|nr:hypothetical protein [Pseudarthrobacter oxydans]MDR7166086.1 hypothetical protein [Pseudarthrobacter oxydans]